MEFSFSSFVCFLDYFRSCKTIFGFLLVWMLWVERSKRVFGFWKVSAREEITFGTAIEFYFIQRVRWDFREREREREQHIRKSVLRDWMGTSGCEGEAELSSPSFQVDWAVMASESFRALDCVKTGVLLYSRLDLRRWGKVFFFFLSLVCCYTKSGKDTPIKLRFVCEK